MSRKPEGLGILNAARLARQPMMPGEITTIAQVVGPGIVVYGRGSVGHGSCDLKELPSEWQTMRHVLNRRIGLALQDIAAIRLLDKLLERGSIPLAEIAYPKASSEKRKASSEEQERQPVLSVSALGRLSGAWLVDIDTTRVRLTELGAELGESLLRGTKTDKNT